MSRPRIPVFVSSMVLLVSAAATHAALKQVDAYTWREDFDEGTLRGWRSKPDAWKLGKDGERTVLVAGGPDESAIKSTRITGASPQGLADLKDYAVEVSVRKEKGSWAGLLFRAGRAGSLEVMFREGGRLLIRRQPRSGVVAGPTVPPSRDPYRKLRVVGVGPVIRVYVDGQKLAQFETPDLLQGRPGLVVHFVYAMFDDFVVTTRLRPEESVLLRPKVEEAALFAPGEQAVVPLQIWNAFRESQKISIRWARLDEQERPGDFRTVQVGLSPGKPGHAELGLGALPEGVVRFRVEALLGEKVIESIVMPVAVVAKAKTVADDTFFPIGVYDKFRLGGETWFRNTYLHAMCADLRKHGVNTILSGGVMNPPSAEQLDIVARYGMKVVLRMDRRVTVAAARHPAVLAYMIGDEPDVEQIADYRKRYDDLEKKFPGKPIVSCLVGETTATLVHNDPWRVLPTLKPKLTLIRYYPMRKENYNLLRPPRYKGWMPPDALFRLFEITSGEGDWWYVAQAFGGVPTVKRNDPYWRNPTGDELRGMCHMALANGARGLFFYTYQTERSGWPSLVDPRTLRPEDGKYAALSALSRALQPAADVLAKADPWAYETRVSPWEAYAVARSMPDGRKFLYVVNRDTDEAIDIEAKLMPQGRGRKATLVKAAINRFTGRPVTLAGKEGYSLATARLGPGEGRLWELTFAK